MTGREYFVALDEDGNVLDTLDTWAGAMLVLQDYASTTEAECEELVAKVKEAKLALIERQMRFHAIAEGIKLENEKMVDRAKAARPLTANQLEKELEGDVFYTDTGRSA